MKLFCQAVCLIVVLSFSFLLQSIPAVAQRQPPNIDEILRRLPPGVRNQVIKDNLPKGEMTFEPVSSGSAFGLKNIGAPVSSVPPADAAMRGGTVFITEVGYCGDTLTTKYMYVLFLDEESQRSTFITNQKGKTANLKLYGNMRRWEHNCDSKKPTYREVAGGEGGMEIDFITTAHIRPRFFQVMASPANVQGKIWGPGLNDNLRPNPNVPPAGPVAFSYAQSENKASYNPAVLAALKRAGYPVPDRIPDFNEGLDRVKAAGFEVADINKPYFHGNLSGTETFTLPRATVPKLFVSFHVSSTDIDAEMFVYKPKALSAGNTSASVTNPNNTGFAISTNYPYPFGTSYAHPLVNARNANSGNSVQTSRPEAYVLIPDGLQSVMGAQAFVNLDNDDKDSKFDDFDDKVAGGDDDMVKVVLKAKIKSFTAKAKLEVTKGGEYVKVWNSEEKERGKEFTDLGSEMIVTRKFSEREGDYRILTLWVEGITPHLRQKSTEFKFTYWEDTFDNTPDKEETFTMTVIGIESIEWEGKDNNSRNYTNVLDKDQNHKNPTDPDVNPCTGTSSQTTLKPEAVRVFPGWQMDKGVLNRSKLRNEVKAKIKLSVAPVEPVNIYFDSFDVDDPSAAGTNEPIERLNSQTGKMEPENHKDESWVDKETGVEEDNRGTVKSFGRDSKSGSFVGERENGILMAEFSAQEKVIEFVVSMQPGDNFRIVGSSDEDFLQNLANDDEKLNTGGSDSIKNENKQRIVDRSVLDAYRTEPKEAEILEPDKYASKVLTVWRFFYAEVDYMGEIKSNVIQGNIKTIEHDTPKAGQTKLTLHENLTEKLKEFTNVSVKDGNNGIMNAFQEGKISIRNVSYDVLYNSAARSGSDYIIVAGRVDGAPESRYFLQDDSENWYFRGGVRLADVQVPNRNPVDMSENNSCYITVRYQQAYIVPDFLTLKATNSERDTVEYVRNLKSVNDKYDDEMRRIYKFSHIDTQDSWQFWTIYLLFGHMGGTYEDGDPDGGTFSNPISDTVKENPVEGLTDDLNIGIVIFLEAVIERNGGYIDFNTKTGEQDCIAHEIGHSFGAPHEDKGLMGEGVGQDSAWFSKRTLGRIRSAKHP